MNYSPDIIRLIKPRRMRVGNVDEDNIKMDLKGKGWKSAFWIDLAQYISR
jgi:hypothetical protein